MQLGLTWPLQRLLKLTVPYGDATERGFCWDAHCITLHGCSSLLLVHCESRLACVRFAMSPLDWKRLAEIAKEEIRLALFEAGLDEQCVEAYFAAWGEVQLTRTHGRREVAFLNRAWDNVLSLDLLVDQEQQHQSALNCAVNARRCRCAGETLIATAQEHLQHYFERDFLHRRERENSHADAVLR